MRSRGEQTTVNLAAGILRLALSPSAGGSISSFAWLGGAAPRAILRNSPDRLERSLDASCFPLVPFANRIRGGAFQFRGRAVRLAPNMAGDPNPLHGQGWLQRWIVEEASERRAVLRFCHDRGEWPWTYEARQEFTIDEGGLTVRLACRNLGPGPMPCGLGQHPYFACGPQTRIETGVTDVWTVDGNVLPVEKIPAQGRYDVADRLVCGADLDNGFGGWIGEARISDPEWPYEARISSPDARFFQLYAPAAGAIFAAEPVTHANAALNQPEASWAELGIRILAEGDEMSMTMRLAVMPC